MLSVPDDPDLRHFLDLARRGANPGASTGELCAHKLAQTILLRTPGLDGSAIAGLRTFVNFAWADNVKAAQLINVGRS